MSSVWHPDSIMLRNTSIEGVSQEIWKLERGTMLGQGLDTLMAREWFPRFNKHNFLNIFSNGGDEASIDINIKRRW